MADIEKQTDGTLPVEHVAASDSYAAGHDSTDMAELARLEKSVVRKLDWNLVPLVSGLYLLAFLDRSNIGEVISSLVRFLEGFGLMSRVCR